MAPIKKLKNKGHKNNLFIQADFKRRNPTLSDSSDEEEITINSSKQQEVHIDVEPQAKLCNKEKCKIIDDSHDSLAFKSLESLYLEKFKYRCDGKLMDDFIFWIQETVVKRHFNKDAKNEYFTEGILYRDDFESGRVVTFSEDWETGSGGKTPDDFSGLFNVSIVMVQTFERVPLDWETETQTVNCEIAESSFKSKLLATNSNYVESLRLSIDKSNYEEYLFDTVYGLYTKINGPDKEVDKKDWIKHIQLIQSYCEKELKDRPTLPTDIKIVSRADLESKNVLYGSNRNLLVSTFHPYPFYGINCVDVPIKVPVILISPNIYKKCCDTLASDWPHLKQSYKFYKPSEEFKARRKSKVLAQFYDMCGPNNPGHNPQRLNACPCNAAKKQYRKLEKRHKKNKR